jgi:BMFP domain-containing protein YqiC
MALTMIQYLAEIDFAATTLLKGIWHERAALDDLSAKLAALEAETKRGYERAEDMAALESDVPDDEGLSTMTHWDTYFGPDKQRHDAQQQRSSLAAQVEAHSFSVASLAGDLLQHAKQGISMVHGSLGGCPPGRAIASRDLKDVIWQARNQAIHWEEGKLSPPVQDCFNSLAKEVDTRFRDYLTRSMAMDVVDLLGWRDLHAFEADLLLLA